ncbi:hypothetical protein Salat_2644700 [Sesamum alatum]|uniref:Stigma-specific Stig1 family protein n=1 Tax=Sesamum alatum TaxID=300844 RepID=A0AAE1XNZ4_9LAMI|nr:hypothetical protein Salat_2644700 [Sesamum alatum]
MKVIKILFFIALALTLTLNPTSSELGSSLETKPLVTKRVGRFLQKTINPRAADHHFCDRDDSICNYLLGGGNATCCNNKCVETTQDSNNCGTCGRKCAFGEACCRGECVNLSYDKRHCGFCNNMCMIDGRCVYGICNYAYA